LMMRVIDSHIHVDLYAAGERMQMLSELATYRVEALISVSSNLASSKKNLQLAQQDRRIKSAFGFQDRKSTRLNSSHVSISYGVLIFLHFFPTRRSSDLVNDACHRFAYSC